ncbi:MAG: LysE family translocator [Granulosicoccus sp.]|nr:LysE family translocator [Granulosicoccus sp.]
MNATIAPVLGLLLVSFVTPGPNNFVVMSAAMRGGTRQAVPIMAGIIGGTITLYVLACTGLAQLPGQHRVAANLLLLAGVSYLCFLGVRMMVANAVIAQDVQAASDPSVIGMALFQCLNPKSLLLAGTVAMTTTDSIEMRSLVAVLMATVAAICLSMWAIAGSSLSCWLMTPVRRRVFDIGMGILLVGSATSLLVSGWK